MLLAIAIVVAIVWILCVLLFKITVGAIHLLLLVAVVALIAHFLRRKAPPPPAA